MAYSSSVNRAQVIKLCELCYEDNINWRCTDCEMCLCEKCKTFHLRVPVTAKHQIVTIATPIQDVQRRIITDNIPCKDHHTNMTCLFCQTCDCLVCPECVSTSHTKHQFIPIEKSIDHKLEQLKGIQAKIEDNLKFCDSKITEIENLKSKYNSYFDESLKKIKLKEQKLKDAISQYSQDLQEEVEVERLKVKTIITKVEQSIDEARKKLEHLYKELEIALVSNQGQVIFDTPFSLPVLKFDTLPKNIPNFRFTETTTKEVQRLFGSIKEATTPIVPAEFGFEVLKIFTIDVPAIHQVLPMDDTTAWISYTFFPNSEFRKITIQENKLKVFTSDEISLPVMDMALTSENDILLVKFKDPNVKLMTQFGQIKSFLTVAPLFPTGVHVTMDERVIIGVKELGNIFTPTKQSQRAVVVFGMDGKQKHFYQNDINGKRLFTFPYRIATNHNQDILVIDLVSDENGRVVTLDRKGNLRWIYEGDPIINGATHFHPYGIATTTAGYIIVSDRSSHAIHVLSENGEILTCKVIDGLGIEYPMGINTDKGGNLWVGCSSDGEEGSSAKLLIIKLLEIQPVE